MKKTLILLAILIFPAGYLTFGVTESSAPPATDCQTLYTEMNLEGTVDYEAFEQAMEGYNTITKRKKNILTLIDFTKPSTEPRMFVFDIEQKQVLFESLVAHGRGSGDNYATSFSNKSGSHKSSLGFFLTDFTYDGRSGYSLILNGLEKGINDKARERSIVIHGADYCDPSFIETSGRLGRSFGCPALPYAVSEDIINTIKEGSLLYIYANDKGYLSQSHIISNSVIATLQITR